MRRHQQGTAAVEFAIIGAVFFLVLFAVIEFGRLLYVWESLNEAARRGARIATVCPVNHDAIKRITVFNDPITDGASAILDGLTTDDVTVEYLNEQGLALADPEDTEWCDIRYVRTRITGYQHNLLIPLFEFLPDSYQAVLNGPEFSTTLPRESLGVVPDVGYECFGAVSPTPTCS